MRKLILGIILFLVCILLFSGCFLKNTFNAYNDKKTNKQNYKNYDQTRTGLYYLYVEKDTIFLMKKTKTGFEIMGRIKRKYY